MLTLTLLKTLSNLCLYKKLKMKRLCVILGLLLCCTKVTKAVVVAPRDRVLGVVGDNLTLPCYLKNNDNAEELEVQWIVDGNLVHHYKSRTDQTAGQLLVYQGRTSLFQDELQRGNISLKLSSVTLSDTNTYTCYVVTLQGTFDASFKVQIDELGKEPEVTVKSNDDGSVTLKCTSTNWTIQPAVEWLDNKGKVLPTTEDPDYCYSHDTTLYVQGHLTVKENQGYDYTCKVSYLNHQKEKACHVSRNLFGQPRHHWVLIFLAIAFLVAIIFITFIGYISKKRRFIHYKDDIKMLASVWKVELDLFTKPMIIHGHRKIHISEEAHIHRKKDYQGISVGQLLSHDDHRFVILQGESGLGKSCTLKWIMQEWASGRLYSDQFDLVFLLKCDELALSSQANSLLDLVNNDATYRYLIEKTLQASPHRILFLIDSFSESCFSDEDIRSSPAGPFTKAQAKSILSGLLSGRILPEASLLVTTTPSASDRLNNLFKERPKRFAEILGFTEEGVEHYFKKFFNNNVNTFQDVKTNAMLFTSCLNPVLCWLICQHLFRDTQKEVEVGTITGIFLSYFTIILPRRQGDNKQILSQLCDQAKRVMQEGIKQFEWSNAQFLEGTGILMSINNNQQKKMYRFIHQSFVEFFAALRYVILENEESQREEVEELLISAQNDFLHSKHHLQPVLKFLFGLSNKAVRSSLQNTLKLPDSSTLFNQESISLRTQLKEWILAGKDTFSTNKSVLFLFHCLHELHEEEFVKEVMQPLESISFLYIPLTHSDCLVIKYCLQAHPSIKHLDLRHCNLTAEKLKLLEPVWANLQYNELWLTAEGLENTDIEEFLTSPGKGLLSSSVQNEQTMNFQFSSVKSIPAETVSSLLNIYNKTSNLSLSLEMETAGTDSFCSSLSAERDDFLFILTFGYHNAEHDGRQQVVPEVLFISLTLPASEASCKSVADWTEFLQKVKKLRKDDSLLAQNLHSMPDLKKLEIEVNYLTEDWASKALCCIHTCPNLLDLKAFIGDEKNCREMSVFSSLTLRRVTEDTFCLKTQDLSSNKSTVSLILPTSAVSSDDKSLDLLKKTLRLRDVPEKNTEELAECVKALLDIPKVEKVKLKLSSIPMSLATWILSLCSLHQKIFVTLETPANRVVGSVCSSLCMGKDGGSLKLSVMDGRISSSSYTTPALSGITLQSESDPLNPLEMDWEQFFTTFTSLRGISASSAVLDDHVGAFLLSLTGLHGLKKVDLFMSSLSGGIKERINTLKNACSTLQEARVSCGRNALVGDKIIWVGDDEPKKERFAFTFTVKRPLPHSSEVIEARQTPGTQVNLMQCRHSYCQV